MCKRNFVITSKKKTTNLKQELTANHTEKEENKKKRERSKHTKV